MNEIDLNNIDRKPRFQVDYVTIIAYIILIAGAITMIMPFLWMLSTSLKMPGEVYVYPPKWIPHPITINNYIKVLRDTPFGLFFINTLKVTIFVVIGRLITCSMGAYAFARIRFPGRNTLFVLYIATMMIPYQVTLVPTFILMRMFGLVDTLYALILPGATSAFGTFLLRQFFLTIPKDLEDAAIIDGANKWTIFTRIILPLSTAGLLTLVIFTVIGSWNDFMAPLIFLQSQKNFTLTIGLSFFQGMHSTEWTLLMAATLLSIFPVILLFMIAQKYFIQGIALSGLKE